MFISFSCCSHVSWPYLVCHLYDVKGFPGGSDGKESACNVGDLGLIPGLGRRKWQATLVFLPGKCHGRRNLAGYSPRGHKESDTTEHLHFHFHDVEAQVPSTMFPLSRDFHVFAQVGFFSSCWQVHAPASRKKKKGKWRVWPISFWV